MTKIMTPEINETFYYLKGLLRETPPQSLDAIATLGLKIQWTHQEYNRAYKAWARSANVGGANTITDTYAHMMLASVSSELFEAEFAARLPSMAHMGRREMPAVRNKLQTMQTTLMEGLQTIRDEAAIDPLIGRKESIIPVAKLAQYYDPQKPEHIPPEAIAFLTHTFSSFQEIGQVTNSFLSGSLFGLLGEQLFAEIQDTDYHVNARLLIRNAGRIIGLYIKQYTQLWISNTLGITPKDTLYDPFLFERSEALSDMLVSDLINRVRFAPWIFDQFAAKAPIIEEARQPYTEGYAQRYEAAIDPYAYIDAHDQYPYLLARDTYVGAYSQARHILDHVPSSEIDEKETQRILAARDNIVASLQGRSMLTIDVNQEDIRYITVSQTNREMLDITIVNRDSYAILLHIDPFKNVIGGFPRESREEACIEDQLLTRIARFITPELERTRKIQSIRRPSSPPDSTRQDIPVEPIATAGSIEPSAPIQVKPIITAIGLPDATVYALQAYIWSLSAEDRLDLLTDTTIKSLTLPGGTTVGFEKLRITESDGNIVGVDFTDPYTS